MTVLRNVIFVSLLLTVWVFAIGCVTKASDAEIDQACQQLSKIQGGSEEGAEERLNKCKQDLKNEGVAQKAALCRAKASDLDSFWNKCR
jgi:flagellar biosynthesis/type III secretory pathway protein FliH